MDFFSWPFAIRASDDRGTFYIVVSFVFIAYIFHPLVGRALKRVRAHQDWKDIENGDRVEVTSYSFTGDLTGLIRGFRKWDPSRITVLLHGVFAVVTFGLELFLQIGYYGVNFPGDNFIWVDLMDRPPPIYTDNVTWIVQSCSPSQGSNGYFGNFIQLEETEGTTWSGDVYEAGKATSAYNLFSSKDPSFDSCACQEDGDKNVSCTQKYPDTVKGQIVIARWSGDPEEVGLEDKLFYDNDWNLEDFDCTEEEIGKWNVSRSESSLGEEFSETGEGSCGTCCLDDCKSGMMNGENWGTVKECAHGPRGLNASSDFSMPPTILLEKNGDTFDRYMIVEEASKYFSFLYSVWKVIGEDNPTIVFSFYVESRSRLAEAIITAIVNDDDYEEETPLANGGRIVDFVAIFSGQNENYDGFRAAARHLGLTRASPFGEHPETRHDVVQNLLEVEPIEYGVKLDVVSAICAFCLVLLGAISVIWWAYVRTKAPVDVYDRDELIKELYSPDDDPGTRFYIYKCKYDKKLKIDPVKSVYLPQHRGWMNIFSWTNPVQALPEPTRPRRGGEHVEGALRAVQHPRER